MAVLIEHPDKGWNPVPGDPDTQVWWNGSRFSLKKVRSGTDWTVVQCAPGEYAVPGTRQPDRVRLIGQGAVAAGALAFIVLAGRSYEFNDSTCGQYDSAGSNPFIAFGVAVGILTLVLVALVTARLIRGARSPWWAVSLEGVAGVVLLVTAFADGGGVEPCASSSPLVFPGAIAILAGVLITFTGARWLAVTFVVLAAGAMTFAVVLNVRDARNVRTINGYAIEPKADLHGADLAGEDLRGVDLSEGDLSGADLSGTDLSGAVLSWVDFTDARLTGTNLADADLMQAFLAHTDLSRANLRDVSLGSADLEGTDLSMLDLSGVDFTYAGLKNANLDGARLVGADLTSADLRSTTLRGANLSGASLFDANLRGADITGAILTDVETSGGTIWPDGHHGPP